MRHSIEVGVSFGLASAAITTLGLVIGLHAGTHSRAVVMAGIGLIAIADALSDSLGIHMSEETEGVHTTAEIWVATLATFFSKLIFALTFMVPFLLLAMSQALIACIIWGLTIIVISSFAMAKRRNTAPWPVVGEHVVAAVLVIVFTHLIGHWLGGGTL